MAFESWQAFWQMGKHGLYVWSAYGFVFVGLGGLCLQTFRQKRAIISDIKKASKSQ
ncbi:heme exporter protein CcmD [Marinomonas epiphytica]